MSISTSPHTTLSLKTEPMHTESSAYFIRDGESFSINKAKLEDLTSQLCILTEEGKIKEISSRLLTMDRLVKDIRGPIKTISSSDEIVDNLLRHVVDTLCRKLLKLDASASGSNKNHPNFTNEPSEPDKIVEFIRLLFKEFKEAQKSDSRLKYFPTTPSDLSYRLWSILSDHQVFPQTDLLKKIFPQRGVPLTLTKKEVYIEPVQDSSVTPPGSGSGIYRLPPPALPHEDDSPTHLTRQQGRHDLYAAANQGSSKREPC